MYADNRKTIPFLLTVLCGLFLFSVVLSGSAFAHGKKKHQKKGKMNQHMQAMTAVKDEVPQDYRVMERTPIAPDADSLAQGKKLYGQNCAVCHGATGDGQGPAAAALPTAPANFLDREHSGMYNPGEKFWIIGNGTGATGMPAFEKIKPADRWHLINYLLSLQKQPAAPAAPAMRHHN